MRLSVRSVAVALEKFSHPNPDSPYHSTPSSVHRKASSVDTPLLRPISVHRKADPVDIPSPKPISVHRKANPMDTPSPKPSSVHLKADPVDNLPTDYPAGFIESDCAG